MAIEVNAFFLTKCIVFVRVQSPGEQAYEKDDVCQVSFAVFSLCGLGFFFAFLILLCNSFEGDN